FNNLCGYYNHTTDNLINYQNKHGAPYCNNIRVNDASKGQVCATPNSPNVQSDDPDHQLQDVFFQVFGHYPAKGETLPVSPPMNGFAEKHSVLYNTVDPTRVGYVVDGLSLDKVPHTFALAREFALFDRWFAAVPGPTNPNRAFLTSGTSAGHGSNDASFFTGSLTQKSIFQLLSEHGISWKNYDGTGGGFKPD
ncbi:hypothetical protein HK101_005134, partial [Irineochytrium annulatum]